MMEEKQAIRLSTSLRRQLKEPLGVLRENLAEVRADALVCVGDVVSEDAVKGGLSPKIIIFDGLVERKKTGGSQSLSGFDAEEVSVENPAGGLTRQAIQAVKQACESARVTKIQVSGEEDLLALPAILYSPVGWTVVYGQPGEGVVEVLVDEAIKNKVNQILREMESGF